jgi:heptaprenyl diphosphate synthase
MRDAGIYRKEGIVSCELDASLERVRTGVDRVLSGAPGIVGRYVGYLREGQGKYIRALSLLTCAMDELDRVPENAVRLASAAEVLHLAPLSTTT